MTIDVDNIRARLNRVYSVLSDNGASADDRVATARVLVRLTLDALAPPAGGVQEIPDEALHAAAVSDKAAYDRGFRAGLGQMQDTDRDARTHVYDEIRAALNDERPFPEPIAEDVRVYRAGVFSHGIQVGRDAAAEDSDGPTPTIEVLPLPRDRFMLVLSGWPAPLQEAYGLLAECDFTDALLDQTGAAAVLVVPHPVHAPDSIRTGVNAAVLVRDVTR